MKRNLSLMILSMVLGLSGCPSEDKDAVKNTPAPSTPAAPAPNKPVEAATPPAAAPAPEAKQAPAEGAQKPAETTAPADPAAK